ncbi:hypothetical protein C0993_005978 [Termitomyces sp. T159_Od127]|nr:hypothetical protein C0993_005978 [Termitomyces sp. T159_Od127]
MPLVPNVPKDKHIAQLVLQTIQAELGMQMQAKLTEFQQGMETAAVRVSALKLQVEVMAARIVSLEKNTQGPCGLEYMDALTCISLLQQGSKSIMDYCMEFFKLKGKLECADVESKYMKDHFWKGLNAVAMEALVNMDFVMAEETWDNLLHRES